MSQSFSFKLNKDPDQIVAKFKATAAKNGVAFNGDQSSGQFNGKGLIGHYSIAEDSLTITIEKKPLLIPWPVVESKVRAFFA